MKTKRRRDTKRANPDDLRGMIRSVKNEIECLLGKDGCNSEYRLTQLQTKTLPKLEAQLSSVSHSNA